MEQNKKQSIIIIGLILLIIAVGAIWAIYTYVVPAEKGTTTTVTQAGESDFVSNSALETLLERQPMAIGTVKYFEQGAASWLKHDAMGASVVNHSDVNIQSFEVAFCAFDESGNPIKIKQPDEEGDGGYVRTVNYDMTTVKDSEGFIAPEGTFEDVLMYVNNEPKIVTVKACVKAYVSTDGITWNNPHYTLFKNNYSGKTLTYGETEQP